jgi:hypothetical protein
MEHYVTCPYCGHKIWGINPGDLVNNLRGHFGDECDEIDDDEKEHM